MKNKRGFEFSFGWIFAIFVGAVIILLAIYAASKIGGTEKKFDQGSTAKAFGILTYSFETSLEEDKPDIVRFPVKTRIFNGCSINGNFGKQKISTARASEDGEEAGLNSSFANKYFFSEKEIEGKNFVAWGKPMKMPFKVADVVYILSEEDKYCFIDTPLEIERQLNNLRRNHELLNKTIIFSSSFDKKKDCAGAKEVCFGGSLNCDINVMESQVRKKGKRINYNVLNDDYSLLYAAIFSDPEIYECQLKRLMKRATNLALLYKAKSEMLGANGCGAAIQTSLEQYAQLTSKYEGSESLNEVMNMARNLEVENEALSCPIF